jgi:two-component system, OmpR family, alkaline phosphatase synthesis response regulator PhoP
LNTQSTGAPTVLIVDDEESIRKLVDFAMQRSGFATELMADGATAFERITSDPRSLDIVILDVMLPGMDGFEICRRLRQMNLLLPIILLTARDEEIDRVLGLEIGADDYVTKPFSPRELAARVKAVMRRLSTQSEARVSGEEDAEEPLCVGDITLNLVRHEVQVRGKVVELTPTEFDLLRFFMEHRDRVLTRDQLLDQVWGYSAVRDTRIVDVHVSHLRDKIEPSSKKPTYIRTVRGIGYKFLSPQ